MNNDTDQRRNPESGMDRKIKKKKWTLKRMIWLSLIASFFIAVIYGFFFGDRSSKLNVEVDKITISTVEKGPFKEFIPVTGTVIPIKTVYLDAIEGGRVEKIFLEAGSMVEEGDKILKLANTNLLLDIMFREAELFNQSNNLRNTRLAMEQHRLDLKRQLLDLNYNIQNARREYKRVQDLAQKNLVSEKEYKDTKETYEYYMKQKKLAIKSAKQDSIFRTTQIQQLEASLKRMEENLDIVKQKLENLTIRAPIGGQLTSLNAEFTGEIKSPGERLGQIDVLDGFKVRAGIDEHYLPRVALEQPAQFDFAGNTYQLISKKIYPEIREGRFNVDLEFVDDEPTQIRRGQTLHLRLYLSDLSEALLLDRGGFYQKTGGQWVYVVDESGDFAVKRSIRIGRQNPQVFEILKGLKPGEKVITSSYDHYGDIDKLILKSRRKK